MNHKPWKDPEPASNYFNFDNLIWHVKNNDLQGIANLLKEGAGSPEPEAIKQWLRDDLDQLQQGELVNLAAGNGNYEFLNIMNKAGVGITTEDSQRQSMEFINQVIGPGTGPYGTWRKRIDELNVKLLTKKLDPKSTTFKEGGGPRILQVFRLLTLLKNADCDFRGWSGNSELPLESVGQALNKRLPKTAKYLKITDEPGASPLAELFTSKASTPSSTTKKLKM